jgi:hypothetical protein
MFPKTVVVVMAAMLLLGALRRDFGTGTRLLLLALIAGMVFYSTFVSSS